MEVDLPGDFSLICAQRNVVCWPSSVQLLRLYRKIARNVGMVSHACMFVCHVSRVERVRVRVCD